jgi:hypothetical protein
MRMPDGELKAEALRHEEFQVEYVRGGSLWNARRVCVNTDRVVCHLGGEKQCREPLHHVSKLSQREPKIVVFETVHT